MAKAQSIRLNKTMREQIVNSAIEAGDFYPRLKAAKQELALIVNEIRVRHLGGVEKVARLERVYDEASKAFDECDLSLTTWSFRQSICIRIGGHNYGYFDLPHKDDKKAGYLSRENVNLDSADSLGRNLLAAKEKVDAVEKEIDQLKTSLTVAVNAVTTVAKLIELLPELESFVPKTPAAVAGLPALPLESIRAMLAQHNVVAA